MEEHHINLDKRDISQPGNQNDLIKIGGKKQVPCLIINGKALYESDDIVAYLKDLPIVKD
jgi:glutathione S-transferase